MGGPPSWRYFKTELLDTPSASAACAADSPVLASQSLKSSAVIQATLRLRCISRSISPKIGLISAYPVRTTAIASIVGGRFGKVKRAITRLP